MQEVRAKRTVEGRKTGYQVHWKVYTTANVTWEPKANLDCSWCLVTRSKRNARPAIMLLLLRIQRAFPQLQQQERRSRAQAEGSGEAYYQAQARCVKTV